MVTVTIRLPPCQLLPPSRSLVYCLPRQHHPNQLQPVYLPEPVIFYGFPIVIRAPIAGTVTRGRSKYSPSSTRLFIILAQTSFMLCPNPVPTCYPMMSSCSIIAILRLQPYQHNFFGITFGVAAHSL